MEKGSRKRADEVTLSTCGSVSSLGDSWMISLLTDIVRGEGPKDGFGLYSRG